MAFDKESQLPELRRKSKRPLFAVFDGNYYLHRAYHTSPKFTNAEGMEVGAVAGAISLICNDFSLLKPRYVATSFDVPGLNFRHSISDDYKLNDPADPDNVVINRQLFILVRVLKLIGFPVVFLQGVESDDVVGALAVQSQDGSLFPDQVNTVIFTGDKDINQFVTSNVLTCDSKETGGIYTTRKVEDKFGVPPEQIADYLALMGDANDGVKGVPNCGPKKARELLSTFGSIENILGIKAGKHGDKWGKLLTGSNLASLRRDYQLTRIRTDINVAKYAPFELHGCHTLYLNKALAFLHMKRLPSLVKAQLTMAELSNVDTLFEETKYLPPLVDTSEEWDGIMGSLWKAPSKPDKAVFLNEGGM